MPIIEISGIPGDSALWKNNLSRLAEDIQKAVAEIGVLNTSADKVDVFYIRDLDQRRLGKVVVAKIGGVLSKPERTPDVLKAVESAVCDCLRDYVLRLMPECKLVEAFSSPLIEHFAACDLTLIRCPDCKGNGVAGTCKKCGGTGKVDPTVSDW